MLRKICQLRAVARWGFSRPVGHVFEVVNFIKPIENRRALRPIESLQADVVIASFHVGGGELLRHHALEKGNVFLHQLFLKILGAGRDDHPATSTERRRHRGDEIRRAFFPVPVPASTIRWCRSSNARITASAI